MKIFDRFNITLVAGAGLYGAFLALSPNAAATPLPIPTGGPAGIEQMSGADSAAAAAIAPMAGALPGPLAAGVAPDDPPIAGPLPAGAPMLGEVPAGAPLTMSNGILAGKGVPTDAPPALPPGPVVMPGPPSA